MEETRWWSWGANSGGQLGNGSKEDALVPVPILFPSEIAAIQTLACGGAHVVALSEGGGVVSWGRGLSGSLGHGDDASTDIPKPVKSLEGVKIRLVAAGWDHTAIVTDVGELLTCGNGHFGQLGHGDLASRLTPCKITSLAAKTVVSVSCGMRHTIALVNGDLEDTAVMAFGSFSHGQLGLVPSFNDAQGSHAKRAKGIFMPSHVTKLDGLKISTVVANGDHSAAVSSNGALYLWGRGFGGGKDLLLPIKVGSCHFRQVSLGWNHGLGLTEDGQVLSWGSNRHKQLGRAQSNNSQFTSEALSKNADFDFGIAEVEHLQNKKAIWVAAGAEHNAVVLDNGLVVTWGWGEHGQLGLGTTDDEEYSQAVPISFNKALITRVYCGSGFTIAGGKHTFGH